MKSYHYIAHGIVYLTIALFAFLNVKEEGLNVLFATMLSLIGITTFVVGHNHNKLVQTKQNLYLLKLLQLVIVPYMAEGSNGLCDVRNHLYYSNTITGKENEILSKLLIKYLKENYPNQYILAKLRKYDGYWWISGEVTPRVDFIKFSISCEKEKYLKYLKYQ